MDELKRARWAFCIPVQLQVPRKLRTITSRAHGGNLTGSGKSIGFVKDSRSRRPVHTTASEWMLFSGFIMESLLKRSARRSNACPKSPVELARRCHRGTILTPFAFVNTTELQYKLETILTWHPSLKTALLMGTLFLILWVGGYAYKRCTSQASGQAYWRAWCALSGAEPDFSEDPWTAKVLVIIMTIIQLFFFAFLLSLVEQAVSEKVAELRAGRTQVVEVGHKVILGWNTSVPFVLKQLAVASETNQEIQKVAILANRSKEYMDRIVREEVGKSIRSLKVICRSGDPANPSDQQLVAVKDASRVLILSSKRMDVGGTDGEMPDIVADNLVLRTALVLKSITKGSVRAILETHWSATESLVPYLGERITRLNWNDLITKQLVQSAVEGLGFAEVQRHLLRFEGAELYVRHFPSLVGLAFAEAGDHFRGGVLVGIAHKDGSVSINPAPSARMEQSDKAIFVAEHTHRVSVAVKPMPRKIPRERSIRKQPETAHRGNVLVLGWRDGMSSLLEELDRYYSSGTVVKIVSSMSLAKRTASLPSTLHFDNIRVHHAYGEMSDPVMLRREVASKPNSVLVLLDQSAGVKNMNEREARALAALIALQAAKGRAESAPLNVAVELATENSAELARKEGINANIVILDEFAACFIAQAAYNPGVLPVHRQILSATGSDLSFRTPEELFLDPRLPEDYHELFLRTRDIGELLLGYIRKSDNQVVLAPEQEQISPEAVSKFVVLTNVGD
mmetsp:Transcript_11773/g.35904  ORF Transcript_11773/g.35904 Transcript_11773/m.35904 type:complete len:739 (+) Transcript_11773:234-2450(+)